MDAQERQALRAVEPGKAANGDESPAQLLAARLGPLVAGSAARRWRAVGRTPSPSPAGSQVANTFAGSEKSAEHSASTAASPNPVGEIVFAVFFALGRRRKRLGRRIELPGWVWPTTSLALRRRLGRWAWWRHRWLGGWQRRMRRRDPLRPLNDRVADELDRVVDRLRPKARELFLSGALAEPLVAAGPEAGPEPVVGLPKWRWWERWAAGRRARRLERVRARVTARVARRLGGRRRGADRPAVRAVVDQLVPRGGTDGFAVPGDVLRWAEAGFLAGAAEGGTAARNAPPHPSLPPVGTPSPPLERRRRPGGAGRDVPLADDALGDEGIAEERAAFGDGEFGGLGPGALRLARQTWRAWRWAVWRRRAWRTVTWGTTALIALGTALWAWDAQTGHSRSIATFLIWSVKLEARRVPDLAAPAGPWPQLGSDGRLPAGATAPESAADVRSAADLYRGTNIWLAHLEFAATEWATIQPRKIEPLPHFLRPDGTVLLRHPEAQRSGLAGVLGFDFDWGQARTFELGGRRFHDVGVRLKGNGTFMGSLVGDKRAFKVDLNRHLRRQTLGGADELNFNNLVNDQSYVSDALGYQFFREAGVPASRTAFAYLSVTVDGEPGWTRKPLGLYAMVEPVDGDFLRERFGRADVPLFKPVTNELFADRGDDPEAYEFEYDLKTKATPEQWGRLIALARLVSRAPEGEFAARVGEFFDLDALARFWACQVLLSNYDGPLSTGQNFHLYLDPGSGRFGFIPWDLDLCWGGFFLLGTPRERERASIWHPWVGENRFLERLFAVEAFRVRYRDSLETLLARQFVPSVLAARIDALAAVVREPVRAESAYRHGRFEWAVGSRPAAAEGDESPSGARRPIHVLKLFIERRARSVRAQLNGQSEGVILQRKRDRDRRGNINRQPDGDLPDEPARR